MCSAMCGARQQEDASRDMWIRMLTVAKTVVEAEQDRYFDRRSLYAESDCNSGAGADVGGEGHRQHAPAALSAAEDGVGALREPSVVSPEAWNALLGLSIDYVVKKRAALVSDTIAGAAAPPASSLMAPRPQRSVLQSELESLLGPAHAEEAHWWIVARMDRVGVTVTSAAAIKFLAAETAVGDARVPARSATMAPAVSLAGDGGGAALPEEMAVAARRAPPCRKVVMQSRVALVGRQLALRGN